MTRDFLLVLELYHLFCNIVGGVVSPMLANILLDKLDKFVEKTLIPKYTKGNRKRANQEYHSLIVQASKERKQGNVVQAEHLRKQAQKLPSINPKDPEYRRLRYVRYADDVRHLTRC